MQGNSYTIIDINYRTVKIDKKQGKFEKSSFLIFGNILSYLIELLVPLIVKNIF